MVKLNPFTGDNEKRPWFWWGINIGIVLAILVWWWLETRPKMAGEKQPLKIKPKTLPPESREIPIPEIPPTPREPDDLTKISGIGPKSAKALRNAGIFTFVQLAEMTPDEIKAILTAAGVRFSSVDDWPEQAAVEA